MRESQRQSTRDRLVDSAMRLFYERGYNATGLAEVLKQAGVNAGSLYYFFKSKEELLLAVLDQYEALLWPVVIEPAQAVTADPIERIFAVLKGYRLRLLQTGCTGGCPIANLALEVADAKPEVRARVAKLFDLWCDAIRQSLDAAADRLPRNVDRAKLARFVLTVMEGGIIQARAHSSIAPFDEAVANLRDYFERLLPAKTRKGRKAKQKTRPGVSHRLPVQGRGMRGRVGALQNPKRRPP